MKKLDVLIIGAGLAGLSTAYYLSRQTRLRIGIAEQEKRPGQWASGQNASMVCQISEDPVLCRMTTEGARLLKSEFSRKIPKVEFRRCGSIFLGSWSDLGPLRRSAQKNRTLDLRFKVWERSRLTQRYPVLSRSQFEAGLFYPDDGVVESKSLVHALWRTLRQTGVRMFTSTRCRLTRTGSKGFAFITRWGPLECRRVVNATGAWAAQAAESIGAQSIPLSARRRHLFLTYPQKWANPHWPIFWDVSTSIYLRTQGCSLLISPCDEEVSPPGAYGADPAVQRLLEQKLKVFFPRALGLRFQRIWSGLRTFSPDGRFVIGWDGKLPDFFWVACLDGHGLTACASIGKYAARLFMEKPVDSDFEKAFSPARFLTRSGV